ncbi:helix-turn-helix transcriptional regulator [Sphingobacterium sp. SRCM116780]|uniref:helix-turn-helix domain-containing protein n=1 Tax=Sphingobacterium sp. SRCM116780 TaxID=2907623 RepID=UPI001F2AD080|nr:helix-turn-helix transcriptional regulator [Sphingobacterium sp. SRCM116780]UIR56354.1 helix-turn-helix transcriptional regulator [Sphingobacterium sp. SRCM116780]
MKKEAQRLKEFRTLLGLTQTEFSEGVEVSQAYLSKYENGQYEIPIDFVKALYRKYKLNYEWFFHGYGKPILGQIQRATITTDVKELLLENKILKSKIESIEKKITYLMEQLDK